MGLEVALEVEDLELILLRKRKELAHRGIRLDDLLDHQAVLLGVAADASRHLRAAQERALGDAKERAERIRDRRRLGEDSVLLRLLLAALSGDGLSATALLGLLELARDLLLELLHAREHGAERGAQDVDLLDEAVELRDDVHGLGGDSGRGDRRSRRGRGGSDGGRLDVRDLGGDGRRGRCSLGRRLGSSRGGGDGRGGSDGCRRRGDGLTTLLGSSGSSSGTGGSRGGRAHLSYVVGRGSF